MAKINKKWGLGMIMLLIFLLSACSSRVKNETIIISAGKEASAQEQHDLNPVQVKKIYRLPDENIDKGYWLGWTSSNSIVGAFKKAGFPDQSLLKQIVYPYEQSKILSEVKMDNTQMMLSSNGSLIADMDITRTTATLELFSLKDKKKTEVDTFNIKSEKYFQNMSWSENSQFISYLILDTVATKESILRIYDTSSNSAQSYRLNGFNNGDTILDVKVSNDVRSALVKLYDSTGKATIILGRLADGNFESKYRRQIANYQMVWISNDQFAFLGRDGNLYEYDQRNGELSIVLERVAAFEFSADKRFIAYKLQDEDIIYVGKMQGRNVLYNEPVYHGILPLNMKWSPDNTSLLVQGSKIYANPKIVPNDVSVEEPSFIIEFE